MQLTVVPRNEQPQGEFDHGAILERKPVAFRHEGGRQHAVSTLFYWAHAWSPAGGVIELHPHQGFEIMSFVLAGRIRHYDTALARWNPIHEGGAQVIRAGSGISHAERLEPGASIFQIWMDPDLRRSLRQPPSYSDYPPSAFGMALEPGYTVKTYVGPDGPMRIDTPDVLVREYWLEPGAHQLRLGSDRVLAGFLRDGGLALGVHDLAAGDFAVVRDAQDVNLRAPQPCRLFAVTCPARPAYRTFASVR